MKFIEKYVDGKPAFVNLTWSDHWPGCEACRRVNIEDSGTLKFTCALGARLVNEVLIERQVPEEIKKQKEILAWAQHAGVFKV